jgi:fatty acid desaturase
MTNENTEGPMDPSATFRLDQEAAATEAAFWDATRREEATTTLAQRQSLTRRVNAQASLMEGLNVFLWAVYVVLAIAATVAGFQGVIGWFQ